MIISDGKLAADGSPEELQQMMQVRAELEVTAVGTKEHAEEVLKGMEQIVAYTIEHGQEEDSVAIHVETADEADIRKELSMALSRADMPILSMNRLERTLEDIFLKLTEDAQKEDLNDDSDL